MATWKELGEVPDSEDEDGFDSQDVEEAQLQPVMMMTKTTTIRPAKLPKTGDIWDFPDSDTDNNDEEEKSQLPGPLLTIPLLPDSLDSSPLSAVPSDEVDSQDLFQDQLTPKATSALEEASHDVTPQPLPTSSSHIEVRLPARLVEDRDEAAFLPVANILEAPAPDMDSDHHSEEQRACQIAMRHERSLRPRKPIQEHPYLLENAHYSTFLRAHGVKPLKMAVGPVKEMAERVSRDADFEMESQEEPLPPEEVEKSQQRETTFTLEDDDELLLPSSPLETLNSSGLRARNPSLPESPTFDDHNVFDQDLPDLAQLLNIRPPPRSHSPTFAKRKAPQSSSGARKRQRQSEAHNDEAPSTPDHPNIAPDAVDHGLTVSCGSSIDSPTTSPPGSPEQSPKIRIPVIDIPPGGQDDDESDEGTPAGLETPSVQSESEGEELVTKIGRRIRGVLPASWLRLDHQSSREKQLQNAPKKQLVQRSPGKGIRRGVAQPKQNGVTSTAARLLFEDPDEKAGEEKREEASSTDQRTTDAIYHYQTRLDFSSVANTAPQESFLDLLSSDDAQSIIEEDSIDLMLPGRKRQLNLSQAFDRSRKRVKKPSSSHDTLLRKKSRQPRITRLFQNAKNTNSARPFTAKRRQSHAQGPRANRHQVRKLPPPRLSILDVIQADAPRFIKIAARTAKSRPSRGRSSLQRKSIKLASREDNVDAISVLEDWRSGLIKQRPAVSLAIQSDPRRQHPPQPLSNASVNGQKIPKNKPRKLMRYISQGGSISYRQSGGVPNHPSQKQAPAAKNTSHGVLGPVRPAQLEVSEAEQPSIRKFDSIKKMLDRSFRKQRPRTAISSTLRNSETDLDHLWEAAPPEVESAQESQNDTSRKGHQSKANSFHKQTKPRRIDIEAPQYLHADDPLPTQYPITCPEPSNLQGQEKRLQGLGPYGTRYTLHFEMFPLDSGVYFHESTLIGSGAVDACFSSGLTSRLSDSRPRIFFKLGEHMLRWGPWDETVSSELGIVFDFIAEQVLSDEGDTSQFPNVAMALDATSFVLRYVKDALSLGQESLKASFLKRLLQVLCRFCSRLKLQIARSGQVQRANFESLLMILDRLLLLSFLVLRICQTDLVLFQEQLQIEETLKMIAHLSIIVLKSIGLGRLRETYEATNRASYRERGLRTDAPVIHSWTLLLKILELARIHRSSFWEMLEEELDMSKAISGFNVQDYEQIWEDLFTLLPLTEFNTCGIIVPGKRYDIVIDGWIIPQKLLKRVFELYQANDRQAPSFNNYCRALLGRCHYLLKQWGWHRSAPLIGVIFDFFGSQKFAHLRNEEVYRSPQFLEELAKGPSLDLGPDDRCFHIFLKLLALSISELRKRGSEKDIRNLVARTIPNHNHQYSKEQTIHERVLAALRNHHDLICTLYWACPPKLRPSVALIENLVSAETSHKEACLLNVRAWSQLARFAVASGEATSFPKAFGSWRNSFFQKMLQQFESIASDIQQQVSLLSKDDGKSVSEERIKMTVSMNKAAIKQILSTSLAASLDAMRHALDLEAACFCFGTPQLQQVFKYFTRSPLELDWSMLRAALATLDSFLSKVEAFKDNEESQQNESQMLRSAQADDALMVIDNDLSSKFFQMARFILSFQIEPTPPAGADLDRDWCVEEVISLAARMGARFIHGGSMRISDMFRPGKYGLFDGHPKSLDLMQRKYLALFLSHLVEQGFNEWADAKFGLAEVWILSLVKPREYLEYEYQLGQQLQRHGEEFVPDAIDGLSIRPDYNSNRNLFEFAAASLRGLIRDAQPTKKKILMKEYASIFESAMTQIKGDLKLVAQGSREHYHYVIFVQDIISLIKVHDICAVDGFFYKKSKEYTPSTRDPQLKVAGMVSYGLRLQEGEMTTHQLFSLLFNNFKVALTTGKLHDDVGMLLKAMKHQGIFSFVLGKMLPSTIRACFIKDSAFVLLDVYVEALRLRLMKNVAAFELGESDLPQMVVILRAIIDGIDQMCRSSSILSGAQTHVLRQTIALMNIMWPSLFVLSTSQPRQSCWKEIKESVETLLVFVMAAERYLSRPMLQGNESIHIDLFFEGFADSTSSEPFDVDVNFLTREIVDDITKNWVIGPSRISVQASGQARGTQTKEQGIETPVWDVGQMVKHLNNEIHEWLYWASKLSGSIVRPEDDYEPLYM